MRFSFSRDRPPILLLSLFLLSYFNPPKGVGAFPTPVRLPLAPRDTSSIDLLIDHDFPDPSIIQDADGMWYAFATASGLQNIQAAWASTPSGPWTHLSQDILPNTGAWTSNYSSWAPDVRMVAPGKYVMYYSGQLGNETAYHCIGTAVATSVLGPYDPAPTPFACPLQQGGAIDPAGYYDVSTGRRYVLYKVDGNAVGSGGYCNNGVAPFAPTPIMLQEVSVDDGVTKIGDAVEVFDRNQDADGPLVEAPDLFRVEAANGTPTYVLLYSNHCFDSPGYTVSYATAAAVNGPYTRSPAGALIQTGDWNLTAPGGATVVDGEGGYMVFHANCGRGRCMFGASFSMESTAVDVGG
ncbi:family 43 glycosyl hydrolase [Podospora aff. communis PSN243]|uniref:Family 43 glycosyl hydrolase n=1 Tax=Podospora aff. communis PSN243 TaxID=3040156 RepID=A0AAV9H5M4_9PEZI|nr:family 43 glycosyl hydrolase [Podospora aff. communis PSN243]